jgi:hypothetical protein
MANSDALQRQYTAELAHITEKLREVGDERRRGERVVSCIEGTGSLLELAELSLLNLNLFCGSLVSVCSLF